VVSACMQGSLEELACVARRTSESTSESMPTTAPVCCSSTAYLWGGGGAVVSTGMQRHRQTKRLT
jgi:hypothetical protein